jgi:hypothetical protein
LDSSRDSGTFAVGASDGEFFKVSRVEFGATDLDEVGCVLSFERVEHPCGEFLAGAVGPDDPDRSGGRGGLLELCAEA